MKLFLLPTYRFYFVLININTILFCFEMIFITNVSVLLGFLNNFYSQQNDSVGFWNDLLLPPYRFFFVLKWFLLPTYRFFCEKKLFKDQQNDSVGLRNDINTKKKILMSFEMMFIPSESLLFGYEMIFTPTNVFVWFWNDFYSQRIGSVGIIKIFFLKIFFLIC